VLEPGTSQEMKRMNLAELQKKLTAAARLQPPDERVPYAFEKRILTLIATRAVADRWALWTSGLWRAAISCMAVALVAAAVALFTQSPPDNGKDFSQDFENTLLASADQPDNSSMP
jgi:anti-sigma-K factor RskA